MSRLKEVAKFAREFEAAHTTSHALLLWTRMTLTVFGVTTGPTRHALLC